MGENEERKEIKMKNSNWLSSAACWIINDLFICCALCSDLAGALLNTSNAVDSISQWISWTVGDESWINEHSKSILITTKFNHSFFYHWSHWMSKTNCLSPFLVIVKSNCNIIIRPFPLFQHQNPSANKKNKSSKIKFASKFQANMKIEI